MTLSSKALISARPWTHESALAGLFASATVATIESLRVIPEQLARGTGAGREQGIRLEGAGLSGAIEFRVGDDEPLVLTADEVPGGWRMFVPAVTEPVTVSLGIPSLSPTPVEFELAPVRDWQIHVVHHSHLDVGYTDLQHVVLEHQRSFLDSALDLLRETADWPADSRFRWVVESLWAFELWAESRPAVVVEEFLEYVREGRIELTALPFNVHSDTCSTEELHELLGGARAIADRYGIAFDTAMQTDVPGAVVGLPEALADFGVEFLAVAHNWAGRSMPQLNGGQLLPRLFRWAAPSGKSVLVWMTDSPHGMAYMEGPLLGFHDSYESVRERLPVYLASLARNPYPFPPGVYGWHGTSPALGRDPYPWDIVHLRTQGWVGDNAPARLQASAIARQWNETYSSPRLVMSTNAEFFREAERRLGDEITTVEGDWGDWWVEGVGSAAHLQAMVRDAQARVPEGNTIASLTAAFGGAAVPGAAQASDHAYRQISLFSEHTWGAANSWLTTDAGYDSGELQWHWKAAQGLRALESARSLRERSAAHLAVHLGTAPGALASYYVVNSAGTARDGLVRLFVRESVVPFGTEFQVVDGRSGESLLFRVEAQSHVEHRESGRWVIARVGGLPPAGFVRLDLVSAPFPADTIPVAADPLVLENGRLRVTVDLGRACIASIVDLADGRELLNPDSLFGGNEYIYDTYTTAPGFNHHSNRSATTAELELLGDRARSRPAAFIERVDDTLEQRLVYEFAADGVERVRVTLRLEIGPSGRLTIENRVVKRATRAKESAFFAFPFADRGARMRFEVTGGITGDGLEHVPGAPQHMRSIRDWVTLEGDRGDTIWASRDAPLVQRGSIAVPYAPFPASTAPVEPATVLSWLHNNVWDTNFPIEQAFDTTFAYAIAVPEAGQDAVAAAMTTAAALAAPPVPVLGRSRTAAAPAEWSLLAVDDPRVQLVGVLPRADGRLLVRLQSYADEAVQVRVAVDGVVHAAWSASFFGEQGDALALADRVVTVPVARLGTTGILLELQPEPR